MPDNILAIQYASMGNYGGKYSTASTITPSTGYIFNAIQIVTDAALTCTGNVTGLSGVTFTAGSIIYGQYTSVTIASGSVIAYHGKA